MHFASVVFNQSSVILHCNSWSHELHFNLTCLPAAGQNEQVRQALGEPGISGRGVRVLAMDGGGMKGMAMVEQLRQIEARAGRPIGELFDVIGGTSTGALLAVGLGVMRMTLDDMDEMYRNLGNKVSTVLLLMLTMMVAVGCGGGCQCTSIAGDSMCPTLCAAKVQFRTAAMHHCCVGLRHPQRLVVEGFLGHSCLGDCTPASCAPCW